MVLVLIALISGSIQATTKGISLSIMILINIIEKTTFSTIAHSENLVQCQLLCVTHSTTIAHSENLVQCQLLCVTHSTTIAHSENLVQCQLLCVTHSTTVEMAAGNRKIL